jgi:hypothetical protein
VRSKEGSHAKHVSKQPVSLHCRLKKYALHAKPKLIKSFFKKATKLKKQSFFKKAFLEAFY